MVRRVDWKAVGTRARDAKEAGAEVGEAKEGEAGAGRCIAQLWPGLACEAATEPGSNLCSYHYYTTRRRELRAYYSRRLTAEERTWVATAAQRTGVDAEIPIVRLLIGQMLDEGDFEGVRRGIRLLVRALETAEQLAKHSDERPSGNLERVLDQLGRELEE